jgi:hypothetical protein
VAAIAVPILEDECLRIGDLYPEPAMIFANEENVESTAIFGLYDRLTLVGLGGV